MPRSGSAVACAELSAPACLYLLQISTMHRFQSLVVTLKPSGWPTLISPSGICMHTQYTSITTELTENVQHTKRHTVIFFLASYRKKRSKFASYAMASLCKSTIILTSNTFKVVIVGILAFFYFFIWILVNFKGNKKSPLEFSLLWTLSDVSYQLNCDYSAVTIYFIWDR